MDQYGKHRGLVSGFVLGWRELEEVVNRESHARARERGTRTAESQQSNVTGEPCDSSLVGHIYRWI